jgi:hypothetical protein
LVELLFGQHGATLVDIGSHGMIRWKIPVG